VLKVADPAKFALDVDHYRLVPYGLINLVAILIPWIEITAGAFVLSGIWLRAAALVIAGLATMFFFAIVSALARGLNIECGCFGTVGGKHIGLINLAIDTLCFSLAALLAKRSKARSAEETRGIPAARISTRRSRPDGYFQPVFDCPPTTTRRHDSIMK
jgi:putative oxidoreductase